MYSKALIPVFIAKNENTIISNIVSVMGGILLLSMLAQVVIPLPFTPVPITGQTFGVALVSLLWGSKRGASVLAGYLILGSLGAPVFASGASGMIMGPTLGYLVGMFFASMAVGFLADRGFTQTFWKSLFAAYVGSIIIFTFGLIGLSYFVPNEALLSAGLIPFLPGDLIKNTLAALISNKASTKL